MPRRLTRRRFLSAAIGSVVASGGAVAYMRWAEPFWLELSHVTVPGPPTPGSRAPVRVLHLSDFHLSPVVPIEFISEAIELGLSERPDLIVVTGDFITKRLDRPERYCDVLRRLSAHAPTFACVGNHDGGIWARRMGGLATIEPVLDLLRAAQIRCLLNATDAIECHGRLVQVTGVGDLWAETCEPDQAFAAPRHDGSLRLLLNHNPDAKDLLRRFDWDVMLCGHTHGGQLRLPLLGAPFAPVVDHRYIEGLHAWENRWLYITRGVGNLHGLRFNCRPQVSVLDIG